LTVVLLTVILTINRRLRNHRGRLRLLDLRLCLWGQLRTLRRLLLPAASLPVILTIVLRRLRNHLGLLRHLHGRLRLLRPAILLTAPPLAILLLLDHGRLRNYRRLLRRRLGLRLAWLPLE